MLPERKESGLNRRRLKLSVLTLIHGFFFPVRVRTAIVRVLIMGPVEQHAQGDDAPPQNPKHSRAGLSRGILKKLAVKQRLNMS